MPTEKISAEKIISKYDEGMSLPKIAKHFKTNKNEIIRCLIDDGGEKGKTIVLIYLDSSKIKKVTIREVVKKYEDGLSIEQIANEYDVDDVTVFNRLKDYENIFGISIIRKREYPRRTDLDSAVNDIIKEYKDGTPLMGIAEDYDCCGVSIRRRIDEYQKQTGEDIDKIHDENIRQKGKKNKETDEDKAKENIENAQTSILKIASLELVCNIIKKYNYSFEKISEEAKMRGYKVLPETYLKAFEVVRRQKNTKEIDGEEVEY